MKDSRNEFIKSYVDNKGYEHISDDASSPESEEIPRVTGIFHPKYPVIARHGYINAGFRHETVHLRDSRHRHLTY